MPESITDRQRQVLTLLARGRTRAEVAREIGVSVHGIKYLTDEAFRRLGARNIMEAVTRAGILQFREE